MSIRLESEPGKTPYLKMAIFPSEEGGPFPFIFDYLKEQGLEIRTRKVRAALGRKTARGAKAADIEVNVSFRDSSLVKRVLERGETRALIAAHRGDTSRTRLELDSEYWEMVAKWAARHVGADPEKAGRPKSFITSKLRPSIVAWAQVQSGREPKKKSRVRPIAWEKVEGILIKVCKEELRGFKKL